MCEENGLEKSKDKIITSLHQKLGIPIPFNHVLTTPGKTIVDFSNFPEPLVKPFLKELLIEIYSSKNIQFVEIVVSFLSYYSQYNRNLKTWKPTPIDDTLIRTLALDLVNICESDEDVRIFLKFAGYDSDAILSILDPEPREIQDEPVLAEKRVSMPTVETRSCNRKIFIVHGHDEKIKNEVEGFIKEIKLEPIILHKQADLGKTIIEKVEHYSDVDFAIIILTSDDIGCKKVPWGRFSVTGLSKKQQHLLPEIAKKLQDSQKLKNLQPRARQNVIFEFGYFIGRLGRNKVAALCEMGLDRPSDIDGLLYTPLDETGEWKKKLAQEINAAGIEIDQKYL